MTSVEDKEFIERQKGAEHVSSITVSVFESGQKGTYTFSDPVIVYLSDGAGTIVFNDGSLAELNAENLYLIAAGKISLCVLMDTRMVVCRISEQTEMLIRKDIENFPGDEIMQEDTSAQYAVIESNMLTRHFFAGIILYLNNGFNDDELLNIKTAELHHILCNSISRKEYVRFFALLLNRDYRFQMFVQRYAAHVSTVAQLAELANMSPRLLNSRFREQLGISPKEFLLQERIKYIKLNLLDCSRSLKDIAYGCGISVQYLTYLCKKEFDRTPTQIRYEKSEL